MKPSFQAILFDMDGVIVDSEKLNDAHVRNFLVKLGVDEAEVGDFEGRGLNTRAVWELYTKKYNLIQSVDELIPLVRQSYLNYLQNFDIQPIAGAVELIEWAGNNAYKLALVSSANPRRVELFASKIPILQTFSVIVHGDDVTNSKPHPEPFLLAAERLNIEPSQCVVIEDALNGVRSAKAANMYTIAYTGAESIPEIEAIADATVHDLSEIKYLLA